MAERIKELLLGDKGRKILIVGALAVMLLLLLSTVSCKDGSDGQREVSENASEIERTLEERLTKLISQIDGVGSVSVMITLDTVSEAVYEKNLKTEGSAHSTSDGNTENFGSETEVVLAGSAKEPLRVGTVLPKVRGAAVVCTGASDPTVREKVTNAVAKALDIGVSRVYVTG